MRRSRKPFRMTFVRELDRLSASACARVISGWSLSGARRLNGERRGEAPEFPIG
jgi:hypothetical protein